MTIATLCMAVCGAVCGYFEAQEDADTIAAHKPINYFQSNAERLGLLAVSLCAIIIVCLLTVPVGWWDVVKLVAAWPAAFTIVFRYRLNTLRGLDWRYISPSNRYDWFFFWLGSIPGRGLYWWTIFDPEVRKIMNRQWGTIGYHAAWPPYVKWAHRGGTLAYVTEAAILLAALLT